MTRTVHHKAPRRGIRRQLQQTRSKNLPLATSLVDDLIETFSVQERAPQLELKPEELIIQQSGRVFVKLFPPILEYSPSIELHPITRRICYYALALLHENRSSHDPIVKVIANAVAAHITSFEKVPDDTTLRKKLYHYTRVGRKWKEIIADFADILRRDAQHLLGLLGLLGSASTWERANREDCRAALEILSKETDIERRSLERSPLIRKAVNQLFLEISFVDNLQALPLISQDFGTKMETLHTKRKFSAEATPLWTWSLVAFSKTAMKLPNSSEDARILLTFLSFVSNTHKIPFELFRGALPRPRWDRYGQIVKTSAIDSGLVPELCSFFSDSIRLNQAFAELETMRLVSSTNDAPGTFTLNGSFPADIRESFSEAELRVWRYQALLIIYRAVPWKYLDSTGATASSILPHLQAILQRFEDLKSLPITTKEDLALTLLESCRLSKLVWKRAAIDQAENVIRGLEACSLQGQVLSYRSLLNRISGMADPIESRLSRFLAEANPCQDIISHAATGQAAIQHALNCIQVEALTEARESLEAWVPQSCKKPPAQQIVVFRKQQLLGRIARYQGALEQSRTLIENAYEIMEECTKLSFDEDRRDLVCDYADTLRELNETRLAEQHLRKEIIRQEQMGTQSGRSLLATSLAESLFAQEKFEEAEELCLQIQSRPNLLKMEKLRLHITMAKIYHIRSDYDKAISSWSAALDDIRKFELHNGRTTRLIIMSIYDSLSRLDHAEVMAQGHTELMSRSLEHINTLDQEARPGGIQYWIAGARHWVEYLQRRGRSSRI